MKGFDEFTTTEYGEGGKWLIEGLRAHDIEVDFMPNHLAPRDFPMTLEAVQKYDAILLSDIGSNSLYLHPETFSASKQTPNRLDLLRQYVEGGGGLIMIGGYMSFSGINGVARYQRTPLAEVLPAFMVEGDDRVEVPEGAQVDIIAPEHPVVAGIRGTWPHFLGYNQLKEKPGSTVIARRGEDVFIAAGEYGTGRSLVFASDCGPHWGPPEFVNWEYYGLFWAQAVRWVAGSS
ncbi:MAG: cytoplasmic protein [Firmicutes bacterium]|nr:cytoplasmic protein [Bacillota bacterium]